MNNLAAPTLVPLAAGAPELARRLTAILAPLAILVAARFRLLGDWTVPLWTRLNRASRRFDRILARFAAGRVPRSRQGRSGSSGKPPIRLPASRAWLLRILRHEVAVYTNRLERLLGDPEVAAIVAACPAAARALRPLCHLLGTPLPPFLQPPRTPLAPRSGRKPARASSPPSPQTQATGDLPGLPAPSSPSLHPITQPRAARLRPPVDGCYCADPASSPWWPFPRRAKPPLCPS